MTTTITKTELKNLLKRRSELLSSYIKLDENCYHQGLQDIYNSGRKDISVILYKIDSQLLDYVNQSTVGKWLMQIKGMNFYIAASLIAYFDVTGKECAAQFISYAGLDGKKPHSDIGKIIYILKDNLLKEYGYYYQVAAKKRIELLKENIDPETVNIRADRFMMKLFISHLFEEMYREENNGSLPKRYDDYANLIIEPEVPYTK